MGARVNEWALEEWGKHVKCLESRLSVSDEAVREIRARCGMLIWHCEDHRYTRLVAYCPNLYARLVFSTFFEAPAVFRLFRQLPRKHTHASRSCYPGV